MPPHKFIGVNAWIPGSGTIGRCGLVGVGVALLKVVCHWGWALGFQKLKPGPAISLFLLSAHPDIELSANFPAPCVPECCHASCQDNNGLNLRM